MKKQNPQSNTNRCISLLLTLLCMLSFTNICAIAASTGSLGVSPQGIQWKVTNETSIVWLETAISDKSDTDLAEQIKLFASELESKGCTSQVLPIKYCDDADSIGENDIVLSLSSAHNITAQGFSIEVPVGGRIVVKASDADGLFYGCRYVIRQLILGDDLIVGQTYTDSPDMMERGLSLDCGRKYFTPNWIKEMIREISWSNMNTLYLHFSEEMGLGIALDESYFSDDYKWIAEVAGRDGAMCTQAINVPTDNSVLTVSDMREIAEVAKLYHVEIVPSFDSPGHLNYLIHEYNKNSSKVSKYHSGSSNYADDPNYNVSGATFGNTNFGIGNYFYYNNRYYIVEGSSAAGGTADQYSRCIDIASQEARDFVFELYRAYGTFFRELGCTKFDIGGDELLGWGTVGGYNRWQALPHWDSYAKSITGNNNAVAYDAFLYFMNTVYGIVEDLGFDDIRMWNDDVMRSTDTGWNGVVQLNSGFSINYWTNPWGSPYFNTLSQYAEKYNVVNYLQDYNYYVLNAYNGPRATAQKIYNEWNPYIDIPAGSSTPTTIPNQYRSNVTGGAYAIWCDIPNQYTEDYIMSTAIGPIRANAAKCWETTANTSQSYTDYAADISSLGNAPANLKEATITYGADYTALIAAIEEYDSNYDTNRFAYTKESFGKYTAAVDAGREILNGDPSQSDVNKALDAINAAIASLENKPVYDASDLNDALNLFENCNSASYTTESYNAYKQLAVEAEAYLNSDADIEQAKVDNYFSRLTRLSDELVLLSDVSENNYLFSVASRTDTANLGKYFIFAVGVEKGHDFVELKENIRIYDDLNNRVYVEEWIFFNSNQNRDMYQIKFQAQNLGRRTYTIYIFDTETRERSSDSLSCTVTVW